MMALEMAETAFFSSSSWRAFTAASNRAMCFGGLIGLGGVRFNFKTSIL